MFSGSSNTNVAVDRPLVQTEKKYQTQMISKKEFCALLFAVMHINLWKIQKSELIRNNNNNTIFCSGK